VGLDAAFVLDFGQERFKTRQSLKQEIGLRTYPIDRPKGS
jgi:hypothetical protein